MASMHASTSTGAAGTGSSTASGSATSPADASIEGEAALDPELPCSRSLVARNDHDDDPELLATPNSMAGSTATLRPLPPFITALPTADINTLAHHSIRNSCDNDSLRIPREPPAPYGDDNADGDDDGNMEDIEDGDEFDDDDDDDGFDQLFERPSRQAAAMASATALFAAEGVFDLRDCNDDDIAGHISNIRVLRHHADEEDMDEVEKSFINCSKPICSKKELVSCLSSRSVSPGPISPLLSDEDFPSLCSSSSTAPSSRRSSDVANGANTPRVRFKKGCVITAVNLTWAPTTYDRAPIDVAESLDIKRCQTMQDAEGDAASPKAGTLELDDVVMAGQEAADAQQSTSSSGQWQAFAPDLHTDASSTVAQPGDSLSYRPPSPPAASSPCTAAHANYAYASTFGSAFVDPMLQSQYATVSRRTASADSSLDASGSGSDVYLAVPDMFPSSSSGMSYRNSVGYPFARPSYCFESSSTSSSCSSSESEGDDGIETYRRIRERQSTAIFRPSVRSAIKNVSKVSANATAETSFGVAARELSDSFDESSRSNSPAPVSAFENDNGDYLSSTPRATGGAGPLAGESFQHSTSPKATEAPSESAPMSRQDSLTANGTHDTSPPPPEDQPARKMQRRSCLRERKLCTSFAADDLWGSCDALGGF